VTADLQQKGHALFLYLTTQGRRSGVPREIEIWYTRHKGRYYVIAEHDDAHWVQNLVAHPMVSFRVEDFRFEGTARVVEPEKDPKLTHAVQQLSKAKYGWGDGLVIELVPENMIVVNKPAESSLHNERY
jgi:deazaflavin-dependent oxidoreductase (nitroreductase family)